MHLFWIRDAPIIILGVLASWEQHLLQVHVGRSVKKNHKWWCAKHNMWLFKHYWKLTNDIRDRLLHAQWTVVLGDSQVQMHSMQEGLGLQWEDKGLDCFSISQGCTQWFPEVVVCKTHIWSKLCNKALKELDHCACAKVSSCLEANRGDKERIHSYWYGQTQSLQNSNSRTTV